jgi:hydrogenase maturation factor
MQGGTLKIKLLVLTFAGVTVLGVRAHAHHSFAATYNEGQKTTVEADVVQFLFRNPHSFLQLETKDAKTGKVTTCAVEWGGGGQLGSQGVQRETLRPGDHVIVVGEPGRDPDACRMRMISIKRPSDGWSWGGTFD